MVDSGNFECLEGTLNKPWPLAHNGLGSASSTLATPNTELTSSCIFSLTQEKESRTLNPEMEGLLRGPDGLLPLSLKHVLLLESHEKDGCRCLQDLLEDGACNGRLRNLDAIGVDMRELDMSESEAAIDLPWARCPSAALATKVAMRTACGIPQNAEA